MDLTTTVVVAGASGGGDAGGGCGAVEAAVWRRAQLAATVLEPASEQGKAGLDELHQQTVGLLSFQSVPKDVYDTQVAFNLKAASRGGREASTGEDGATDSPATLQAIAGGGCDWRCSWCRRRCSMATRLRCSLQLERAATEQEVRDALQRWRR